MQAAPRKKRKTVQTPVGRVVFEPSGRWWSSSLPAFQGAYGQGRTVAAAYQDLLGALSELIKAHQTAARRRSPSARRELLRMLDEIDESAARPFRVKIARDARRIFGRH